MPGRGKKTSRESPTQAQPYRPLFIDSDSGTDNEERDKELSFRNKKMSKRKVSSFINDEASDDLHDSQIDLLEDDFDTAMEKMASRNKKRKLEAAAASSGRASSPRPPPTPPPPPPPPPPPTVSSMGTGEGKGEGGGGEFEDEPIPLSDRTDVVVP